MTPPPIDMKLADAALLELEQAQQAAKKGTTGMIHEEADIALCNLLRKLGYNTVVDRYEQVEPKWYE